MQRKEPPMFTQVSKYKYCQPFVKLLKHLRLEPLQYPCSVHSLISAINIQFLWLACPSKVEASTYLRNDGCAPGCSHVGTCSGSYRQCCGRCLFNTKSVIWVAVEIDWANWLLSRGENLTLAQLRMTLLFVVSETAESNWVDELTSVALVDVLATEVVHLKICSCKIWTFLF